MKLYAPKYYKNFKCIADKCKHSCCVGWEIDIDQATVNKYTALSHPYSSNIMNSICFNDSPCFKLKANRACTHLNESGLCNLILNCGEEYLCDICREHPRFYNFTNLGKEVGIGMSCEAACNLILNSNNFYEIEEIAEIDGVEDICEYDATYDRGVVFNILRDDSLPIDEKIKNICKSFNICFSEFSLLDIISRLEFLNANHKILFSQAEKLYWNNILSSELTRILAYFVYRHCSEACDYDEFCESLCYSIFCTGLISALSNENTIEDIARIVSEEVEYSPDNTNFIKSLFY